MQKLLAKKLNKKGFTLAELLIVVAIIAVLVAIAIPIFTGSLEKARLGVHRSNARNLKSMAVSVILADAEFEKNTTSYSAWKVVGSYDFDAQEFTISSISATVLNGSPKMYAGPESASASSYPFDESDKQIGKMNTSGTAWYTVDIVAQDLDDVSVSWKS